ncbi:MAG: ankyrin repeat domain-containing protein [Nitrospinae bacterium]|nr:ankyrin repeat domain-containing protein [Nitrospinota bacterium]
MAEIVGSLIVSLLILFIFEPFRDFVFGFFKKICGRTRSESQKEVNIGQDIDATSLFQDRLLFIEAAKRNDVSAIEALLQKGVDINTKDTDGNTALIWASRNGQKACIQKLVEKGATIDEKNGIGETALIIASRSGYKDIVELLIKNAADVNLKTNDGNTAFTFASYNGHVEVVDILKKSGVVPIKYQDPEILKAAFFGDVNTLRALLKKGVSPNTTSIVGGETPLMYAIGRNHIECIELLLEFGADVNRKDSNGHTAIDVAKNKPNMLDRLCEKYTIKMNERPFNPVSQFFLPLNSCFYSIWNKKEVLPAFLYTPRQI